MDAFAVSICKGLSVRKVTGRQMFSVGLWFGGFQALMPLIGYFAGVHFASVVSSVDHWIAFILLGIIGGNMIKEALSGEEEEVNPDFSFRTMLTMAVATSIDALAVGVSLAFLRVDIWSAVLMIGLVTGILDTAEAQLVNITEEGTTSVSFAGTKREQGDAYAMTSGAWYVQADAYAKSAVGKTASDIATLATEGVAGCTMPYSTYDFKAGIEAAVKAAK